MPSSPTGEDSRYLRIKDPVPTSPLIHESIARLDKLVMDSVETGRHEFFLKALKETGNTVCGRHPIGVVLASLEIWETEVASKKPRFKFVRYERSSDAVKIADSSVSYASAFAVI